MEREVIFYSSGKKRDCQKEGNLALSSDKVCEFKNSPQSAERAVILEQELNTYYRSLRKHLHCPKEEKEQFLQDVKLSVDVLRSQNSDLVFADVLQYLGDSRELAQTFLEKLDSSVVAAYKKRRKRVCTSILACALALIVGLGCTVYYLYQMKTNAVVTQTTTIIVKEID